MTSKDWKCVGDLRQELEVRVDAASRVLAGDVPLPRKEHLLWRWATDVVFSESVIDNYQVPKPLS